MSKVTQAQRLLETPLLSDLFKQHIADEVARWIGSTDEDTQLRYHAKVNAALDIEHYITEKCREIIEDGSTSE